MNTVAQDLATLRQYALVGVEFTGREIGRGSYASVHEMNYHGLRCAGKKINQGVYGQRVGDTIRRFAEEFRLLSQLRHPSIVQFLGVYFERGVSVPVLVMEYLPTTLSQRIDRNAELGSLPDEVLYSIVADVALGINYLHGQSSPIVHRDLSASNILLTKDLTAKISDLGVAKILHLNPLELCRLTKTPGTPCYMPPEALEESPQYDTSVDIFSYGVLLIHVFSGKWPFPTKAVTVDPEDPNKLTPVSEAERRQQYLDEIAPDHPLMDLILKCISNSPTRRPAAAEVLQEVKDVEAKFTPANKEELLQRVKALSVSLQDVEERAKCEEENHTEDKPKKASTRETSSGTPDETKVHSSSLPQQQAVKEKTADQRSSSKKDKEDSALQRHLTSMQSLHASLEVDLTKTQENVEQIKAAQLSESRFYAELEDDKEQSHELVAKIEKRQESVESLLVDLKNAEVRGGMRVAKLQEAFDRAQRLCGSLQRFLQVRDATVQEFQDTQQKLGELMQEAFQ